MLLQGNRLSQRELRSDVPVKVKAVNRMGTSQIPEGIVYGATMTEDGTVYGVPDNGHRFIRTVPKQ